jgi:hypothetical protein
MFNIARYASIRPVQASVDMEAPLSYEVLRLRRELYLRVFKIVVAKADPGTIMAAYSRLNDVYCARYIRPNCDCIGDVYFALGTKP